MAEEHRHGANARTVDHREVGVADAGRLDAHEHLTGAGIVQIELDDTHGP